MNRLFGTKNTAPKATLHDAIASIDERVDSVDVKLAKVNSELSVFQQKISKMRDGPGKTSLKQRALTLLKQRKQLESQKDQLQSQSWNISQAEMTTQNLKNTMITIDAMKTTNKALKKTYGKIDVSSIEDLQDEMLDLIDKSNDLQSALSSTYDVDEISESELDAELDALAEDEAWELDNVLGVPTYLEEEVPAFIDEEKEEPMRT